LPLLSRTVTVIVETAEPFANTRAAGAAVCGRQQRADRARVTDENSTVGLLCDERAGIAPGV
jgi:hypothetical protein